MKKLLISLIAGLTFFVLPHISLAAISVVQTKGGVSYGSASIATSFTSNLTAGNTVVVAAVMSTTTVSISDTRGSSFTLVSGNLASAFFGNQYSLWCATNVSAGADTVTLSASGAPNWRDTLYEVSGLTCTTENTATTSVNTASTSYASVIITTSNSSDLLISHTLAAAGAGSAFTPATGWTGVSEDGAVATAYIIKSAGTQQATGTYNATDNLETVIYSLEGTTPAAGPTSISHTFATIGTGIFNVFRGLFVKARLYVK